MCVMMYARYDLVTSIWLSHFLLYTSNVIIFFAVVSWKKPANYTGDESLYEPSWLIAENLDQNSLVDAFRKFPTDACPDRSASSGMQDTKNLKTPEDQMGLDNDDFSDEDEEEQSEEEEEEDVSDDIMQEYEEEDNGKSSEEDRAKDPDVSHLEDSGKVMFAYIVQLLQSHPFYWQSHKSMRFFSIVY